MEYIEKNWPKIKFASYRDGEEVQENLLRPIKEVARWRKKIGEFGLHAEAWWWVHVDPLHGRGDTIYPRRVLLLWDLGGCRRLLLSSPCHFYVVVLFLFPKFTAVVVFIVAAY